MTPSNPTANSPHKFKYPLNNYGFTTRNLITRKDNLDIIQQYADVFIEIRGEHAFRPPLNDDTLLHAFIAAHSQKNIDIAIRLLDDIVSGGKLPNYIFHDKIMIGLDHAPLSYNVKSRIMGRQNENLKYIQTETGEIVWLKGKGSGFPEDGQSEPMHIYIKYKNLKNRPHVRKLVLNMLQAIHTDFVNNGFAVKYSHPKPIEINPLYVRSVSNRRGNFQPFSKGGGRENGGDQRRGDFKEDGNRRRSVSAEGGRMGNGRRRSMEFRWREVEGSGSDRWRGHPDGRYRGNGRMQVAEGRSLEYARLEREHMKEREEIEQMRRANEEERIRLMAEVDRIRRLEAMERDRKVKEVEERVQMRRLEEERVRMRRLEEEQVRMRRLEEERIRMRRLEEEQVKKLEEEKRLKLEMLKKLDEERQRKLEEERLRKLEQERLRKVEEERLRRLEEERKIEERKLEETRLRLLEEERVRKVEEERLRKIEAERQRKLKELQEADRVLKKKEMEEMERIREEGLLCRRREMEALERARTRERLEWEQRQKRVDGFPGKDTGDRGRKRDFPEPSFESNKRKPWENMGEMGRVRHLVEEQRKRDEGDDVRERRKREEMDGLRKRREMEDVERMHRKQEKDDLERNRKMRELEEGRRRREMEEMRRKEDIARQRALEEIDRNRRSGDIAIHIREELRARELENRRREECREDVRRDQEFRARELEHRRKEGERRETEHEEHANDVGSEHLPPWRMLDSPQGHSSAAPAPIPVISSQHRGVTSGESRLSYGKPYHFVVDLTSDGDELAQYRFQANGIQQQRRPDLSYPPAPKINLEDSTEYPKTVSHLTSTGAGGKKLTELESVRAELERMKTNRMIRELEMEMRRLENKAGAGPYTLPKDLKRWSDQELRGELDKIRGLKLMSESDLRRKVEITEELDARKRSSVIFPKGKRGSDRR